MLKSHFILLILLVFSAEVFGFSAHRRVRRNDVKVLSVKTLADGTKFEKIQESGTLPALPIDEEIDDINDSRIGHIDESGDVLVPVDENGKVLPGYEYLLQPIVVEVSVDETNAPKIPNQNQNAQLPPLPGNQNRVLEPSDEFGVGQEDENIPAVPALPPSDYTDSGESDENLKAEDDGRDENEIDIPKNSNPSLPVLIPAKEIDPIPVPVETIVSEEEDEPEQNEEVQKISEPETEPEDFSEEAIEKIAAEFGPQVFANLVNKSSEFWAAQKMAENVETPWRIQPQDVAAEKSKNHGDTEKTEEDSGSSESDEKVEKVQEENKGGSEGYILQRPDSEEIEIGGAQDDDFEEDSRVLKDIVRGGVGPIPDSSKNWELSKILFATVLLYIFW